MPSVSKAEADARVLIEAGTIKKDATRLIDAKMAAARMAEEEATRARAIRRKKGSR